MSRLTLRINDSVYYTEDKNENIVPEEMKMRNVKKCLKKLADYEDLGTVEELRELKEKNTPKRIGYLRSSGKEQYYCGECGRDLFSKKDKYCAICGCKIDWYLLEE